MVSLGKDCVSQATTRCGWSEQVDGGIIGMCVFMYIYALPLMLLLVLFAGRTIQFFRTNLLGAPIVGGEERHSDGKASIIGLQEFWLHHEYTAIFDQDFFSLGYEIHHLQRLAYDSKCII
jgi:hypothetical protein